MVPLPSTLLIPTVQVPSKSNIILESWIFDRPRLYFVSVWKFQKLKVSLVTHDHESSISKIYSGWHLWNGLITLFQNANIAESGEEVDNERVIKKTEKISFSIFLISWWTRWRRTRRRSARSWLGTWQLWGDTQQSKDPAPHKDNDKDKDKDLRART